MRVYKLVTSFSFFMFVNRHVHLHSFIVICFTYSVYFNAIIHRTIQSSNNNNNNSQCSFFRISFQCVYVCVRYSPSPSPFLLYNIAPHLWVPPHYTSRCCCFSSIHNNYNNNIVTHSWTTSSIPWYSLPPPSHSHSTKWEFVIAFVIRLAAEFGKWLCISFIVYFSSVWQFKRFFGWSYK